MPTLELSGQSNRSLGARMNRNLSYMTKSGQPFRGRTLQARCRDSRKRAIGTRRSMLAPDVQLHGRTSDMVRTTSTHSRRCRVLAVVDHNNRECLALVAKTSLSSLPFLRELNSLIRQSQPAMVILDKRTEAASKAVPHCSQRSSFMHYIPLGKSTQNGVAGIFNGKFMGKILKGTLFSYIANAQEQNRDWQHDYNRHRPHSTLGNILRAEFVAKKRLARRRIISKTNPRTLGLLGERSSLF